MKKSTTLKQCVDAFPHVSNQHKYVNLERLPLAGGERKTPFPGLVQVPKAASLWRRATLNVQGNVQSHTLASRCTSRSALGDGPPFAHLYWAALVPLWTTVLLLVGSQETREMTWGLSIIKDRTCFTYISFKLKCS